MEEQFDTFEELPEEDSPYYLNKVIRDGLSIGCNVKRKEGGSFYDGESSRGYVIEDGATDIGPMAFHGCLDLERIDIPEGIVEIREKAFYGCANLVEVHLPSTLRKIGFEAFRGCGKLKHINLHAGVEVIEKGAFEGCSISITK